MGVVTRRIWGRGPAAIGEAPLRRAAIALTLIMWSETARGAEPMLVPPTPKQQASAQLIFLPDEKARLDAPLRRGERRVLMTGAYSSGDRFAPEGFVVQRGDARLARLQGWDGLLLIDGEGRPSLHNVAGVGHGDRVWNLRDREARREFVQVARREGLSAVQSHLLINEGVLDLRPAEGAPRAVRRLLFETDDGRIGVYDTRPRALTLYEAAQALRKRVGPRFALNLDMGTYDFCEKQSAQGAVLCGRLRRDDIGKLTNVLAITLAPGS
ncbi:MAG: hypothetical protein AAF909_03555 [Pseudomonadota bacterium]